MKNQTITNSSYLPAYEDRRERYEPSAYKIPTPGNYPEESIQHVINMYLYVVKEEVFNELKHMPKVSCAVTTFIHKDYRRADV
jgi:hypothetical protein